MRTKFKNTICTLTALFTLVAVGSLCAKTPGEKVDRAIEQTEDAAKSAKDKASDLAKDAKDKVSSAKDKAKSKAHRGIDKL